MSKKDKKYNDDHNRKVIIQNYLFNLLPEKWPHPAVISNEILSSTGLDKFYYTEKLDGLHTFILISKQILYNVTEKKNISEISLDYKINFYGDCIIETEFYNGIYYIFDVYYLNRESYKEKYIDERINSINPYINELGKSFKIKKYNKIPSLDFLLDYIKKDKSPEGNEIDGIILQRKDKSYLQSSYKEFNAFKFKPLYLNTVDFQLKYDNGENLFSLYLYGDYNFDYLNNFKKLPKDKGYYEINDYKNINTNKVLIFL